MPPASVDAWSTKLSVASTCARISRRNTSRHAHPRPASVDARHAPVDAKAVLASQIEPSLGMIWTLDRRVGIDNPNRREPHKLTMVVLVPQVDYTNIRNKNAAVMNPRLLEIGDQAKNLCVWTTMWRRRRTNLKLRTHNLWIKELEDERLEDKKTIGALKRGLE
ncbi:hypothetical protein PHJA_002243500 [Phtheirospermum japonicum]|uniref:Uncharacterized protein n=1 Tax=Phtheirospermum japonicum TaxID=374723 RepID=A0A830D186_9LAMI|nr:hypothetical protein PHJA_002243500 [Phtheirospermum japonicum]